MKAYPCIGGPLDGQKVTRDEFSEEMVAHYHMAGNKVREDVWPGKVLRPAGPHVALSGEYIEFNRASRAARDRSRAVPSMIWLWRGFLP